MEWLSMPIAGVSTALIRSRMRFMPLIAIETGDIQNRKLFARCTETDGVPDGLTMEDCGLRTALWGGSGIARLRPNGEVERRTGLVTNSQDIEPHVC
jgi:sugar lactone lactonase YvrE